MADTWAAAEASEKVSLFHATLGVRQVEVGLASVVSILFGITVTLYGITMWNSPNYARWVAILALVGFSYGARWYFDGIQRFLKSSHVGQHALEFSAPGLDYVRGRSYVAP